MAVSGKKAPKKFISSMHKGSCENLDIFCQTCDRDDIRLPAFGFCVECEEHLCESCFNHHKRAKPSRHHTLLDKHNMPQSLQVSSQPQTEAPPDAFTKPCSKHKMEIIKFFCHDHNALLCSVCVTLKHQSTGCRVDYIPDIAGNTVNSNEYNEIIKEIDTMVEIIQDTAGHVKKLTEKSNASLTNILTEIPKFRAEINQKLDVMENKAKNKTRTLKIDNDQRLKAAQATCGDVIKNLQDSSDSIKQLNKSKGAGPLFVELKTTKQLIKKNQKKISLLRTAEDVKEYHFQPNQHISNYFESETSIGSYITSPFKPQINASVKFSRQGEIKVIAPQDKGRCWIRGMTLLTSNKLIVADYENKSIKMIDTKSYSLIDQLQLKTNPNDVITVSKDELAVTMPDENKLLFVSSSSNRLKMTDTIKVDGECYGIHFNKEQLIVLFQSPAKLQIIDLKGNVLKSITKNKNLEDIFNDPIYVTASSSSIYVSDSGKNAVIQLNWQGEVTGTYSVLGAPAGLAMLADGSFFMSDFKDGFCNIQNIHTDCFMRGEVVLKDLKNPFATCWCEANKTLYISSFTNDASADNFVQVYKMS